MHFVFSHVEYFDMHFVYGFCDGNARAAVDEYQRRFADRRIPSVAVQSERKVVPLIKLWASRFFYIGTGVSLLSKQRFLYI